MVGKKRNEAYTWPRTSTSNNDLLQKPLAYAEKICYLGNQKRTILKLFSIQTILTLKMEKIKVKKH